MLELSCEFTVYSNTLCLHRQTLTGVFKNVLLFFHLWLRRSFFDKRPKHIEKNVSFFKSLYVGTWPLCKTIRRCFQQKKCQMQKLKLSCGTFGRGGIWFWEGSRYNKLVRFTFHTIVESRYRPATCVASSLQPHRNNNRIKTLQEAFIHCVRHVWTTHKCKTLCYGFDRNLGHWIKDKLRTVLGTESLASS